MRGAILPKGSHSTQGVLVYRGGGALNPISRGVPTQPNLQIIPIYREGGGGVPLNTGFLLRRTFFEVFHLGILYYFILWRALPPDP